MSNCMGRVVDRLASFRLLENVVGASLPICSTPSGIGGTGLVYDSEYPT